jgi:hypothetical protein
MQTPSPIHTGVMASNLDLPLPGYAHQSTQPYTELNAGVAVPGQKTMPKDRLKLATQRNKTVTRSNEGIFNTVTPVGWRLEHWEHYQGPADLMFVGKIDAVLKRTDAATLNLAQMQELLLRLYQQAFQKSQDHTKALISEFEQVTEYANPGIKAYMDKYMKVGERFFTSSPEVKHNVEHDMHRKCFMGLSRQHILEAFPFAGGYVSDDGRDDATIASRTINICWQGPTIYQEVYNVWGPVHEGHLCGLILKRRYDPQSSTLDKKVYKEFYLQPWSGFEPMPGDEELEYYDDAGYLEYGVFIPVGRAYRAPLNVSEQHVREVKAGYNREMASRGVFCETVALNMGPSRACLDMYAY